MKVLISKYFGRFIHTVHELPRIISPSTPGNFHISSLSKLLSLPLLLSPKDPSHPQPSLSVMAERTAPPPAPITANPPAPPLLTPPQPQNFPSLSEEAPIVVAPPAPPPPGCWDRWYFLFLFCHAHNVFLRFILILFLS